MPIYEYECLKCGTEREVMQKISDQPLAVCPLCGGEMKKLISNTSFVLKGEGWYVTDYASGDRKRSMDAEKTAGGSATTATADKGAKESADKPSATTGADSGSGKETKAGSGKESKKEPLPAQ